ncbi:TSCPD domain-containing protein, partial [Micromonospora haikouensis]
VDARALLDSLDMEHRREGTPPDAHPQVSSIALAGLTDALSSAITTALRAGAPPTVFVDAFRRTRYVPAGATSDPDVPYATSLGDYLDQRLHRNHPDGRERP